MSNSASKLTSPFKYEFQEHLSLRGFTHLFDTMRYDSLFFASEAAAKPIIEAMESPEKAILNSFEIDLVGYNSSKREPRVTEARLLSTMRRTPGDTQKLSIPFRWKYTTNLEGNGADLVRYMAATKARPYSEHDAHLLEATIYQPETPIKMLVTRFQPTSLAVWPYHPGILVEGR